MSLQNDLKDYMLLQGVSDVGFSKPAGDTPEGLPFAVTLVVRLSPAIIDEIDNKPTHTYFNHYRTVNAFIDRALLMCGLYLQKNGYRYITVAASQSINTDGWNYRGRFWRKRIRWWQQRGFLTGSTAPFHSASVPARPYGF